MTLNNTDTRYGAVAKTFHWLTALLIVTVIPLGIIANGMAHDIRDATVASTNADIERTMLLFSLHKTTGVTIFFVALARIVWAISQPKPGLLNAEHRTEAFAAETVHWLLYGSLLLVPLTGWIHHSATTGFAPIWWPFGQSLPFVPKDEALAATFGGLHMVFERVLVVALFLHIAGALKHHFIDRDMVLLRMWPGQRALPQPPAQHHSARPVIAAIAAWAIALGIGSGLGVIGGPTTSTPASRLEQTQSGWTVTQGTLGITITQMGNQVTGTFDDWTAAIAFSERDTDGQAGHVDVTISIGSLSLGSVTAQAMGPDFFDTETFPVATFSGDIEKSDGGYITTGPLTIRDQAIDITLPFTLSLVGDTATMSGAISLHRLDFNVGASLPDESSLGFGVDIEIGLTATRESGES